MYFCERNSKEGVKMRFEKCDEGFLVDTLKIDWVNRAWVYLANDRVITRND
jgi:hypothetical protein